jgi:hypothetical protein
MPRLSAFAPFRIRSYRFQWPADLLTSRAFEMGALILGWYVLVETGSVLLLTVFGALGYGGRTHWKMAHEIPAAPMKSIDYL